MRLAVVLTLGLLMLPRISAGQEKEADPKENVSTLSMHIQGEATGLLRSTIKPN